ncbi:MAG: phosphatidylglycerol lysyltransferase domain-containing protein [Sandaracinaceae bacterium]
MEALVRMHGGGDPIACAALQTDMRTFETSWGAIVYRRAWGHDVTLGGPLSARSDRAALMQAFLRTRRRPTFCYLGASDVEILRGSRLHVAGMGVDRVADVAALVSAPPKTVRGAIKKARRGGVMLQEASFGGLGETARRALSDISADYLSRAECTVEMSFLNRPMSDVDDGLRRLFLLTERGRLLGFAVLNPVFEAGRVTGYLLDILRFLRTRVWGVWLSTVHALARQLRHEQLSLSLGFAPLCRVHHPPGRACALAWQVDVGARMLRSARYLERLRWLKAQIPGFDVPRYFASPSANALKNLFVLMEVSGVSWRTLFGPDLLAILAEGVRA